MTLVTWPKTLDSYYASQRGPKTPERHGFDAFPAIGRGRSGARPLGIDEEFPSCSHGDFWAPPARSRLAFGLGSNKAHAVGAPAGTAINNTAEVSYTVGTVNATATSNLVTVTVAEILDVTVTAQTPSVSR